MKEPSLEAQRAARRWLDTGMAEIEAQGSMESHLARAFDAFATNAAEDERARIIEELEGTLKNIRRASPTGDFPPYRIGIQRAISIIKATSKESEESG